MSRRQRNLIGPQGMGGLVSLWGANSIIESVQYGTISLSGVQATNTATITSVDLSRSILIDLRQSNNWSGGTDTTYNSNTLALTNSTTITASRSTPAGIAVVASFCVVQFAAGVWRSIQSGLVAGSGTVTATISAVNTAKTMLLSLGLEGATVSRDDAFYGRSTLTNATTVTITRGASAGTLHQAGWLALEGW